jgi:hypothetical protein
VTWRILFGSWVASSKTVVFDNAKCAEIKADWYDPELYPTVILDRFLHRAELILITGKNYRLDKSEKASNGTKAPIGSTTEE